MTQLTTYLHSFLSWQSNEKATTNTWPNADPVRWLHLIHLSRSQWVNSGQYIQWKIPKCVVSFWYDYINNPSLNRYWWYIYIYISNVCHFDNLQWARYSLIVFVIALFGKNVQTDFIDNEIIVLKAQLKLCRHRLLFTNASRSCLYRWSIQRPRPVLSSVCYRNECLWD